MWAKGVDMKSPLSIGAMCWLLVVWCLPLLGGESMRGSYRNYIDNGELRRVVFQTPRNTKLSQFFTRRGELVVRQNAPATVIIAHGYMCSMRDVAFLRWMFPKYNILIFDMRAHGDTTSEQICTFGRDEALDVIAAARFIRSQPDLKDKPIIGYGFSMGAVSIIEAQAREPDLFVARVLDCPFASSKALVQRGLSNLKFNLFGLEFPLPGRRFLEKHAFHPRVQALLKFVLKTVANMDATPVNTNIVPVEPIESIKKVTVPSYFIHCKNDEKIPVDDALSIYRNSRGYKRLWLTNGRRHFDSYFNNPEKYAFTINRFIQKVLSGDIEHKEQEKIKEDMAQE